jgi:hypothetical protein
LLVEEGRWKLGGYNGGGGGAGGLELLVHFSLWKHSISNYSRSRWSRWCPGNLQGLMEILKEVQQFFQQLHQQVVVLVEVVIQVHQLVDQEDQVEGAGSNSALQEEQVILHQ